jgi:hypothetical protein
VSGAPINSIACADRRSAAKSETHHRLTRNKVSALAHDRRSLGPRRRDRSIIGCPLKRSERLAEREVREEIVGQLDFPRSPKPPAHAATVTSGKALPGRRLTKSRRGRKRRPADSVRRKGGHQVGRTITAWISRCSLSRLGANIGRQDPCDDGGIQNCRSDRP